MTRADLAPPERHLPALLGRQAALYRDSPFLRVAGHQWSHQDAIAAAGARAAALAQAGVARGDRVALMCGNRLEFIEVFLACGWLGAVAVPINTASMGPQIGYFLADSQARLLVIEAQFLARLETAELSGTPLAAIWVIEAAAALAPTPAPIAMPLALAARLPADAVCSYPPLAAPVAAADVQPGEPLAILYTSGTTGPAKGVVCPHAQYYWWAVNSADVLAIDAGDTLCTTLPLFHINALNTLGQALVTGSQVVFESRFSASGFWPAMQANGATVIFLLGAMVPILLAQPPGAAERGHRVRIGLGPGVPASAGAAFRDRTGVCLLEGYGSTETNFAIATALDSPRGGVMGWLRPGFEARVADDDDVELPAGVPGELLLRAQEPYAFASGYFNMPQKTVEAWRNLWFHTGDRVVQEADGAYRFIDRIKDAIRRRGENISSYEVEQVLLSHPGVAAVAVYPVRSELAEDEVMAALTVRPGHTVDPVELTRFCGSLLPYFAVPRYVDILEDLPRTENGKVQKYKLRERGVAGTTWDRMRPASPSPGAPSGA